MMAVKRVRADGVLHWHCILPSHPLGVLPRSLGRECDDNMTRFRCRGAPTVGETLGLSLPGIKRGVNSRALSSGLARQAIAAKASYS